MSGKRSAKDPLTEALEEAPVARKKRSPGDVVERPTPRARPVGEVLETLQAQAENAMPASFFDAGATAKKTPVTKRERSEAGTLELSARRREPKVQANVAIDVRCDRNADGEAGRYQVRATGHVGRESADGPIEADVPVSVELEEADGSLKLDGEQMRARMAEAIRSTGTARSRRKPRE